MEMGINHIEIWVSDLPRSDKFYSGLFELIGWKKLREGVWTCGQTQFYLREAASTSRALSLGVHHLCFQAESREIVDAVAKWLVSIGSKIFGGPMGMENYSAGYYAVDFYDPDGMILEVAYTP